MKGTVAELVDWIIKNRKGKAFKSYSPEKIALQIVHCIKKNGFEYSTNSAGNFNGVVCGEVINGEFVVYDVLTTERGIIRKLMLTYTKRFGDIRIVGKVRNRDRHFNNPTKLLNRLS